MKLNKKLLTVKNSLIIKFSNNLNNYTVLSNLKIK